MLPFPERARSPALNPPCTVCFQLQHNHLDVVLFLTAAARARLPWATCTHWPNHIDCTAVDYIMQYTLRSDQMAGVRELWRGQHASTDTPSSKIWTCLQGWQFPCNDLTPQLTIVHYLAPASTRKKPQPRCLNGCKLQSKGIAVPVERWMAFPHTKKYPRRRFAHARAS